jgi:hypothetical protein
LDALYSSSNEAISQAMLIFGTADPEVAVLSPEGEIIWAPRTSHRPTTYLRSGAMAAPGSTASLRDSFCESAGD